MNFQSFCKIITNQSLRHYSHESMTFQIGPSLSSNSCAKSLTGFKAEEPAGLAVAGWRKLVGGDGVASQHQGVHAHPLRLSAWSETTQGGPATHASCSRDGGAGGGELQERSRRNSSMGRCGANGGRSRRGWWGLRKSRS